MPINEGRHPRYAGILNCEVNAKRPHVKKWEQPYIAQNVMEHAELLGFAKDFASDPNMVKMSFDEPCIWWKLVKDWRSGNAYQGVDCAWGQLLSYVLDQNRVDVQTLTSAWHLFWQILLVHLPTGDWDIFHQPHDVPHQYVHEILPNVLVRSLKWIPKVTHHSFGRTQVKTFLLAWSSIVCKRRCGNGLQIGPFYVLQVYRSKCKWEWLIWAVQQDKMVLVSEYHHARAEAIHWR